MDTKNVEGAGSLSIWCVCIILDEEGDKVAGDLTLFNNTLKHRLGATLGMVQSFTSGVGRGAALDEYLNIFIFIDRADRDSIRHAITKIL
ncbi:N-hydroxyarylamine O-acetyltransferase [Penicillium lividum]|nr:N-hydroxyarylamine O-acetyltransferase [Penicillium lividum]